MRRLTIGIAAAVALAGAWLYLRTEAPDPSAAAASASAEAAQPEPSRTQPRASTLWDRAVAAATRRAREESAPIEEATPPLERPATEADGFLELKVVRAAKAVAGAEVRLYLRVLHGRSVEWRLAGAARTGDTGSVRLPARPGAYLASARAAGSALAHRELARRAGEPVTRALIELQEGTALAGRTISAAGGEPLPYVDLELTPADERRGPMRRFLRQRAQAPVEEIARGQSDEKGAFRIAGLSPGRWQVEAHSTGAATATAEVELPRAEELVLSLTASSFIEGRVVDAQGKPAGGAEVAALSARRSAGGAATASGAFSLEVAPGTWRLSARLGSDAGTLDSPVPVAAGATARGVEIRLGKAASIAGAVVRASDAAPIAGARVDLSPRGADGSAGFAMTGPDGSYSIGGLAPGSYDATASADGFSQAVRRGVTVLEGQRFPLQIALSGTGTVQGLVTDSQRAPVASAIVDVQPRGGLGFGGPPAANAPLECATGPDGRYLVSGVPSGSVTVTARRDGAQGGASVAVSVADGAVATGDVQLDDDGFVKGLVRTATGERLQAAAQVFSIPLGRRGFLGGNSVSTDAAGAFTLQLAPGSYALQATSGAAPPGRMPGDTVVVEPGKTIAHDLQLADAPTGFSGKVLEPDGTPSIGARLWLRPGGGGSITDDAGNFTLATARSALPDAFELDAQNGGRAGKVQVASGQPSATVQLLAGGKVSGRLTGGSGATFTVSISSDRSSGGFFFGGGGENSLQFVGDAFTMDDVPAGTLTVKVTTDDNRAGSTTATLASGGTAEVTVALTGTTEVTGRVMDPSGAPITAGAASSDGRAIAPIGADGRFRLTGLSAGAHTIHLQSGPGRSKDLPVTLAEGQLLDLADVVLPPATAAPGTIGAGLRGGASGVFVLWTIPGGPADLAGLLAGDVIVSVDGAPVQSSSDAVARITGAPGTVVSLSTTRNGQPRALQITRAQ